MDAPGGVRVWVRHRGPDQGGEEDSRFDAVDRYLLDIGSEDYCPVCEVAVGIRHVGGQTVDDETLIEMARERLRKLFRFKLVELYLDTVVVSSGTRRMTRLLTDSELHELFDATEPWLPAVEGNCRRYSFASTADGDCLAFSRAAS